MQQIIFLGKIHHQSECKTRTTHAHEYVSLQIIIKIDYPEICKVALAELVLVVSNYIIFEVSAYTISDKKNSRSTARLRVLWAGLSRLRLKLESLEAVHTMDPESCRGGMRLHLYELISLSCSSTCTVYTGSDSTASRLSIRACTYQPFSNWIRHYLTGSSKVQTTEIL